VVAEFQVKDGQPALVRQPNFNFNFNNDNDKAGKPVGIYQYIGRCPILAFGNSDSDMQMIEYTLAGKGRRMGLFVHHTGSPMVCLWLVPLSRERGRRFASSWFASF
jgi:hypothetical protein